MNEVLRILFSETWWSWSRAGNEPHTWTDVACRSFNVVEASAWFIFAVLVFRRWRRFRKSRIELWYGVAFVLFGISDVVETWALTSWLLWWKAANLLVLFRMRHIVIRRFHPDAKVY
jgi:hypothetical protein